MHRDPYTDPYERLDAWRQFIAAARRAAKLTVLAIRIAYDGTVGE